MIRSLSSLFIVVFLSLSLCGEPSEAGRVRTSNKARYLTDYRVVRPSRFSRFSFLVSLLFLYVFVSNVLINREQALYSNHPPPNHQNHLLFSSPLLLLSSGSHFTAA
jgi:hypothetical protein